MDDDAGECWGGEDGRGRELDSLGFGVSSSPLFSQDRRFFSFSFLGGFSFFGSLSCLLPPKFFIRSLIVRGFKPGDLPDEEPISGDGGDPVLRRSVDR